MRDEPQGKLARYAYGFSDERPGWFFWVLHAIMLAIIIYAIFIAPAQAAPCHHYSKWLYPYPQPRCGMAARGTDPTDHSWSVEITKLPPSWNTDEPPAAQDPPAVDDRDKALEQLKEKLK